jgi:hypothetical protein
MKAAIATTKKCKPGDSTSTLALLINKGKDIVLRRDGKEN